MAPSDVPPVPDVIAAARDWIAGDPDEATRAELQALIDAGDIDDLRERMAGSLEFGTAGIRGVVGAGSLRMNRAVVIRTTRGLADHLLDEHGGTVRRPVIVGFDGRTDSERFAIDTIAVLAAAGLPVRWFPEPVPTPLVAYAARTAGAAAAVVITASHNPPEYNGYKVYAGNAAQIIPPVDGQIAAAIDAVGPANQVPRAGDDIDSLAHVERLGDDVFARYLDDIAAARPKVAVDRDLALAYTPLHGVGWPYTRAALEAAGYAHVHVVEEQAEPDGAFPTVAFPNPEEPGALDLAERLAGEVGARLILANDPDVDRLAVEIPDAEGWDRLTGNQIGVLLADHLLRNRSEADAARDVVLSSIVSSPMLGEIAEAYDVRYEATLTGFKWICNAALALQREGWRFVFGYEEALGYSVGEVVRDKDGISAAVVFADLVASLARQNQDIADRLTELYLAHGLWISHQHSVVRPGSEGQAEIAGAMALLADSTPTSLAGREVIESADYRTGADERPFWLPASPLVALTLPDGRALIRPSGTEPKLKIYVDLRGDLPSSAGRSEVVAGEDRLREEADRVARDVVAFLDLG